LVRDEREALTDA